MATRLPPFDGNDYRKRVLAAVIARGGLEASDPFELYDLPLDAAAEGRLSDAEVVARVQEVWGFWQRQRDHPRYRTLVAELVAEHAERSAEVLDGPRRMRAAVHVRGRREQAYASRYELLDAAIERLVARHGGIRRDKVPGLEEVGAQAGLGAAEVATRLRRHRMIDPHPSVPVAESVIGAERRRQIRALLDEFGRLTDGPPASTLLTLLGLEPSATPDHVREVADAWRRRAREMPPQRLRAVVDELLVHVADLIEPGPAAVDAYLDAVAEEVADVLRSRVRTAVLVEDVLVAEDHAHLIGEAVARGLDDRRAVTVLSRLVAELGASAEPPSGRPARRPDGLSPTATAAHPWDEHLREARAALRAGRPVQAQRLVERARAAAGSEGVAAVRAMVDELATVLEKARMRLRSAIRERDARRWVSAAKHLEYVARTARDIPGAEPVDSWLVEARRMIAAADADVSAALAESGEERARLLQRVLERCPGHPGAASALSEVPLPAPAWVTATRDRRGDVVVLWADVGEADTTYRVRRLRPDGSWHVVGRFTGSSAVDGGAPPGVVAPVYGVATTQADRRSTETRSDDPAPDVARGPTTAAPVPHAPSSPPSPGPVQVRRLPDGAVEVSWRSAGAGAEYRVRCALPDGRWRVVGRTRSTTLEDGGAPPGTLPLYAVRAAVGALHSDEAVSG